MTTTASTTAREYLRVSVDKSGRQRSPEEQHDDNAQAAGALGVTLGEPYRDVGSASRYARKGREDFVRLVGDLKAGRFDADILWLWESSRGSRKVSEWAELIELCEECGVRIHVTTHARTYDPANHRDRRSLQEDAVDSEYDSAKRSDQVNRAMQANAKLGLPHGRTPLGYRRIYDPTTRKLVRQEPDPATAPLIRELFARLEAGHSLRGIATDWEARGITNASSRPFTPAHLRTIAACRAYVGEREHTPGRRGSHTKPGQKPVTVVQGNWEALVPKATFLAVQHILSAPERKTTRPGRGVHLLSMVARCGVCGGKLCARMKNGVPVYICHPSSGHVSISKPELDKYAENVVLGYLARDDVYQALTAQASDGGEKLRVVRDEIAGIRDELADLGDQLAAGAISATLAGQAEKGIQARLKAAEDQEAELTTPPRLRGLLAPGKDVRRRWGAAPMATKREVLRILLAPDLLGELRVLPGMRVPVADRVEWRRD
ncbi:recombinase family protein [Kribbella sp. NPDC004536]|uniref:recombinase family protein n=1 Tax=Kribbella sp. NPDC004536 TaxID=3364106 RepID=UPI0036CE4514